VDCKEGRLQGLALNEHFQRRPSPHSVRHFLISGSPLCAWIHLLPFLLPSSLCCPLVGSPLLLAAIYYLLPAFTLGLSNHPTLGSSLFSYISECLLWDGANLDKLFMAIFFRQKSYVSGMVAGSTIPFSCRAGLNPQILLSNCILQCYQLSTLIFNSRYLLS